MILYRVYFNIYRLAQSAQGQNCGLDNRRTDVGFAAEKEILVFSAPPTWDLERIQHPTKPALRTFPEVKSGWKQKLTGDLGLGFRLRKCGDMAPLFTYLHWTVLN